MRPDIEVKCYWGVSGSGKTHTAVEELGEDYYDKIAMNKWWDGYKQEKNVLIDEFRG